MTHLVLVALCMACAETALAAWRQEIDDPATTTDAGVTNATVVDAAGDVVVAGLLVPNPGLPEMAVVKLSGADGSLLWRVGIVGTSGTGAANAVAVDGTGDVVVAGVLNDGTNVFTVVKLAGADGTELWRQQVAGTNPGSLATAVALAGAGDVVAAGALSNLGTGIALVAVKLDGATGAELWRAEYDGTASGIDIAHAVIVDGAGDTVVVGELDNTGTAEDFAVIKLAGASGAELWREEIAGSIPGTDRAMAVAVDGTDDVVAAGILENTGTEFDFTVVKLAGASGTELWRRVIDGTSTAIPDVDEAHAVGVDAAGDVVAAGQVQNRNSELDMIIVKLAGASGLETWRREVTGTAIDSADDAAAVAVDGAGNVVAAGTLTDSRAGASLTALKLSGGTGVELWRQQIDGSAERPNGDGVDGGRAVAVDAQDDVIVGGQLLNLRFSQSDQDMAVLELSGLDGVAGPIPGRRLQMNDRAGDPTGRRIVAVASSRTIRTSPAGSAGDPTVGGATLVLQNPTSLETAVLPLPSGPAWTQLGNPPGARGYRYRDPSGANGPCKTLLVKSGKMRAVCFGTQGTIPFTLDEPSQGSLIFSLQLGTAAPQCAGFGGTVSRDQGTANPGPTGSFVARDAAAFAGACP